MQTLRVSDKSAISARDSLERVEALLKACADVVVGKESQIELAVIAVLARGHILIEDAPGTGKTTLAKTLSALLGLTMKRVQFTNDLLPSDILGSSIFQPGSKSFDFQKGPIFSEVFLGDELNRASPRTQSACLQAMEEGKVSADGIDYELPEGFLFLATQNPSESAGVFPLPDSQLDRFMFCISLGMLDSDSERRLILGEDRGKMIESLLPIFDHKSLQELRMHCEKSIQFSTKIADYTLQLASFLRRHEQEVSTRSLLSLTKAAKVAAFIEGRDYVAPEDVKKIFLPCLAHRLRGNRSRSEANVLLRKALSETRVPL